MALIMCTQTLWRALGRRGQAPLEIEEKRLDGPVLGSWATRLFRRDGRGLVLALNVRTYLTLLFPLSPRADFAGHFATALASALEDLGVPPAPSGQEVIAIDFLPLSRLTDRRLIGSLRQMEFLAHCELDYSDELRPAQRNLNEYPHATRDPYCASDAVRELFSNKPAEAPAPVN